MFGYIHIIVTDITLTCGCCWHTCFLWLGVVGARVKVGITCVKFTFMCICLKIHVCHIWENNLKPLITSNDLSQSFISSPLNQAKTVANHGTSVLDTCLHLSTLENVIKHHIWLVYILHSCHRCLIRALLWSKPWTNLLHCCIIALSVFCVHMAAFTRGPTFVKQNKTPLWVSMDRK